MFRAGRGDVFSVALEGNVKKYFQYVADDLTQLNSEVIRAFKKSYPIDSSPDLRDVVGGEVDFFAHVVIKWGIQEKSWRRAGNVPFSDELDVLFRGSHDRSNKLVKVSNDWYVWKVNAEPQDVGRLTGDYQKSEIGAVVTPGDIVDRMRTGKYHFVYPAY